MSRSRVVASPSRLSADSRGASRKGAAPDPQRCEAATRFVDEQAARLLKKLEERGRLDRTLIIYTSDHGDGGLPVGLSFIGRAWSEPTLLKLAFAFEQATHHRRAPRLLPTLEVAGRSSG